MINRNDKKEDTSELNKLLRINSPKTPSESIMSRRKNCFGPALVVDIQSFPQVHDLCQRTLKSIISIIDPEREKSPFPRKSPKYIKQKYFHASVFSMTPFVNEEDFEKFYFSKAGLDGAWFLKEMQEKAQKYLIEKEPELIPQAFEYNEALGTIFARYTFEPKDFDPHNTNAAPLLDLSRILDPTGKFPIWDSNPYRHRSVAIVLCALDVEDINEKQKIKLILKENSEKLKTIGPLKITNLITIDKYNKRTLSEEHIHIFNSPYNLKNFLQELSFFKKFSHNCLIEHRDDHLRSATTLQHSEIVNSRKN